MSVCPSCSFNIDITTCASCGGAVKIIACIEKPAVISKILAHLDSKFGPLDTVKYLQEPRAPPEGFILTDN